MPVRVTAIAVLLVLGLGACSDDDPEATSTTATTTASSASEAPSGGEPAAEAVCQDAAATLGAADPPSDLDGVVTGAGDIAERAGDPAVADLDPPLADALDGVRAGAELLAAAAPSGDPAAVGDAAATLTDAYDELDLVAADLRLAVCGSESWGRQVVIAAVDLTGAGG